MRKLLLGSAALLLVLAGRYWSQSSVPVQLPATTSPPAGQPATQVLTMVATGLPLEAISPTDVSFGLAPAAGSGPSAFTPARSIVQLPNRSHSITFQIPDSITLTTPTPYRVSISGRTSTGIRFASTNSAGLTINPPARILTVVPNQGVAGQAIMVTVTTQYTNFVQGTTRGQFGPDVSVGGAPSGTAGLLTVTSPTAATAQLVLDSNATVGTRNVTVSTGVQQATLDRGFSIVSNQPVPSLVSATPVEGVQGQSVSVALTGRFTNWVPGITRAALGTGISVGGSPAGEPGPVTVISPTNAIAVAMIAEGAPVGARSLSVQTGGELVTLPNGFTIKPRVENKPPVVNAGPDLAVKLPANANLAGSVVDDGLPVGSTMSQTWTKFAGPGTVTFENASALSTTASFSSPGTYTLRLTASDSILTAFDDVSVQVGSSIPTISVTPTSARQGELISVLVNGQFTNFREPSTEATFGDGVTVGGSKAGTFGDVVASTPTSATASVCALAGSSNEKWRRIPTLGVSPPRSVGASVVLDVLRNRLILFGGGTDNGPNGPGKNQSDSVFVLANANGLFGGSPWSELNIQGTKPSPRKHHSAVYDPFSNRMIVLGGCLDGDCSLGARTNEVWVLENANGLGGNPKWTQLLTPSGPPNGKLFRTAYDSGSNRLVAYSDDSSVWILTNANGTGGQPNWTVLASTGDAPNPVNVGYSAVYDPTSNRLMVFGANPLSDLPVPATEGPWVLLNANGLGGSASWLKLTPVGPYPAKRFNHGATYDPLANEMTIFAGAIARGTETNDAWVLSHANGLGGTPTWRQIRTSGIAPSTWQNQEGVWDPCAARVIAYDHTGPQSIEMWTLAQSTSPAFPGSRNVTVRTSQEEVSGVGIFNVIATNQRPDVYAGPDQTTEALVATLHGSIEDDGLPSGGSISGNWIKIEGPGAVAFTNATSTVTTATFSQPGTYILRLTAIDGALSGSDDVAITVGDTSITVLTSITPTSARQGQNLAVTISGQHTNFSQASSRVLFGSGITVSSISVSSTSILTATITIGESATIGPRSVSVVTGSEVATLPDAFSVATSSPVSAKILSISPNSGRQGQNGPVVVVGDNTNFAQGISQLSVGPGIAVSGIAVTCPTCLAAQFTISPTASPGPRDVTVTTGSQVATLVNGFLVEGPVPTLTTLAPAGGRQGQTFAVSITGLATNFAQGSTQVGLGSGVGVSSVVVNSPTSLTAQVSIAADAALGTRTLTVTTNSEVVSVSNVFNIQSGSPALLSMNPLVGQQGRTIPISVAGQFTSFSEGTTQITLGPDITISSIAVTSSTLLTAQIAIGATAAPGPRSLTVTTGSQVVALPNAFTVQSAPVVILTSIAPNIVDRGQSAPIVISGQGTNFVQGQTQANFGAGVSVGGAAVGGFGPVTVNSPTQLTAQIAIAPAATIGLRTLTVQTGAQQLSFPDGFSISGLEGEDNNAPSVNAGPDQTITLLGNATLNGTASDDGKPTGSTLTLTWSKVSGPGTVTFANPNAAVTTASFSAPGGYVLRLTASDTQLISFDEVAIIVRSANQAPVISVAPSWSVALPARLLVNYTVTDDGLPAGGSLTVAWDTVSGPGDVGYQEQTLNSISVGFSKAGVYTLRLAASDTQFTVTQDITVTVSGTPGAAPTAIISSPTDGAEITTRIDVTGTADSPNLASWTLEYRMAEDSAFQPIATDTTKVTNATLGTFDSTILQNGITFLRLRVRDTNNAVATSETISLSLTKNLKIGNFTVSFNDMTVPMPGLPIQIVRTYDSRNRARPGSDFTYGWSLDIRSVRLSENRTIGANWQGTVNTVFPRNYCIVEDKSHIVTVTMPDGTTHRFRPVPSPQCQLTSPLAEVNIAFAPLPGTTSSLSIEGASPVAISGSYPGPLDLFDQDTLVPVDPSRYRLTLADGRVLVVNQISGLETMTDLNNNRLTVTTNGIQHSSGKAITFTRDAAQRITRITDPSGNFVSYAYNDLTGDLVSTTDRENQTTTHTYDASHLLLTIKDPRGVQPIRNEYDSSGRLIKHIDAFGKEILYNHSLATNQEIVTDRLGNVTVNEYDSDGNVVRVTDALGGVIARTYDSRGNMLSETNANNKTRQYTYDAQDNRLSETDPLGNRTEYTYNSRQQVLTIKDPLGRITTNTYDSAGNLAKTRDPIGNETLHEYNGAGQQTKATDPLGGITQLSYDGDGNLTRQTDAFANAADFTYDGNGNKKSETRRRTTPAGVETLTTSFEYDKNNHLTRTTLPDGATTRTTYNTIGKQSSTFDQLSRETRYTYDDLGRLIQTDFPDGRSEKSEYDAEGRRTKSIDRAGRATVFDYDNLGRLVKTTFADGGTNQTQYDPVGQVAQTLDARGNATRYTYDDAGRRTRVTNALNQATNFEYDGAGNQTATIDAKSNRTRFEYDASNRRVRVVYADGSAGVTGYDALGRTTSKTDQAGIPTQYRYDKLGRLVQVIDALNHQTSYGYDESDNRISQTDAKGRVTRFEYDKLGRRTKRTLPLGQSETMTYDLAGNMKTKTDFNGRTTTYDYDSQNRLLKKTPDAFFASVPIQFTYIATGQRASMSDPSGFTTYSYDLRDRLLSKATPQGTLTYTYDFQGNLTSIRSSNTNGTAVDYAYDSLNRLSTVTDRRLANGITSYTYDANGNLEGYIYPNGVKTTHQYNTLNRLKNLTSANGPTTLASYSYTLGPTGNRTKVVEFGGRTVDYAYDSLHRLTGETISASTVNGSVSYVYDEVGNRLNRTSTVAGISNQSFAYDANDRLGADAYDANGNTTASGSDSFTFDFENRLLTKGGPAVAFIYDGDGNRVSKIVSGVTTYFVMDDRNLTGYAQVLEEKSGVSIQRVYTYGLIRISQSQASGTSFYGYDGRGSVRMLVDSTGTVTDRYDYDAFGNLLSQTGTTLNVYLYSGEQLDSNLGFYYLRARYASPSNGRFLTADPWAGSSTDPPSLHKYNYARNDPTNRTDPSGRQFTLVDLTVTLTINASIESVQTIYAGQLLRTLFDVNKIAYCCIDPATKLQNIALDFISNGGPDWAFDLYNTASEAQAKGYQIIAKRVAQSYRDILESILSVDIDVKIPLIDKEIKRQINLADIAGLPDFSNDLKAFNDKLNQYVHGWADLLTGADKVNECDVAAFIAKYGGDAFDKVVAKLNNAFGEQ